MKCRLVLLSMLLAAVTWAADATGTWKAQVEGRNGETHEITMNLKADGDALTGTVGGQMGETEITGGKVTGDDISFSVVREFQGNKMKLNYAGHVAGDEIHFKVQPEGREGAGREFTAKRGN